MVEESAHISQDVLISEVSMHEFIHLTLPESEKIRIYLLFTLINTSLFFIHHI